MADYLYFNFNGVSSEKYNIYIMNNGEDLSFPSRPTFDNKIVSPLFQGASYLGGVDKKDRVFNFNCWVFSINSFQVSEINRWLNIDTVGELILDYNPNFKYKVKIASISDFKHMAINDDNTSNYEFSITFTTIQDSAAISTVTYNSVTGTNGDGFPIGVVGGATIAYFFNFYTLPFYITFVATDPNTYTISKNDVVHYQYTVPAGTYTINSAYGFCTYSGGLAEKVATNITNKGKLAIDANSQQLVGTVIAGVITLPLTPATYYRLFVPSSGAVYTTTAAMVTGEGLVNDDTIMYNYVPATKITFSAGTYSFNYRNEF